MSKKILIVEDASSLKTSIVKALQLEGYTVVSVSDGDKAVQMTQQEQPQLILLDLIFPNKDGSTILRELKNDATLSQIPVYIFSVIEKMDTIKECVDAGANGYFIKSEHSLEDIVKKINKALEG